MDKRRVRLARYTIAISSLRWNLVTLTCVAALLHVGHAGAARRKRPARAPHGHGKPCDTGSTTRAPRSCPRGTRGSAAEHLNVRRGDTLEAILAERGIGTAEARPWLAAAARVYDLRRIRPRRGVNLTFDRATHALEAVRYQIDGRTLLVLEAQEDGTIAARRELLPYFVEVRGVAGRIERGLSEDAVEFGMPARVVSDLADIFGWDVDVAGDLRPGDEFRVVYEDIWQTGGTRPEPGNVLGAQIVSRGRTTTAIFFEDADGNGGYYRPSGDALSRTFLRYPLEFTEITSDFSLLRLHPILHIFRPHRGVDFAAPRGTPVRAVGDGTVSYAGRLKELGRCVRIDHAGALTSSYGHLSGVAPGVQAGAAVKRGQLIGYVGATGLATGPHLHYALDRDGEYVDPLALSGAVEQPVPAAARRAFERVQAEMTRELASLPEMAHPLTVTLSHRGPGPE